LGEKGRGRIGGRTPTCILPLPFGRERMKVGEGNI